MPFQPGDPVLAPITHADASVSYHPAQIVAVHPVAFSENWVADVHIPDLYRPGTSGYGDPFATVRLDCDTLRSLPFTTPDCSI